MHELGERDRQAILLRFFQGRRFSEVAAQLGLSEDAARMRVERALEKLRALLTERGVASSAAALGLALESTAVGAAPAGLAGTVIGVALGGAATATGIGGTLFSVTTLKLGVAGALAVAGVVGFVVQARTHAALEQQVAALRSEHEAVVALRTENAQLAREADEVAALRNDDRELARLREEALTLKAQLAASSPRPVPSSSPPHSASAAMPPELVTLRLPDADLATAFSALQIYTRTRIIRDPSIANLHAIVNVHTERIPKDEAIELLRAALRDQANIVLEPGEPGTLIAKRGPKR
jgi:hypothetical protein